MSISIRRPRVESMDRPLGLDTQRPRFSWLLESDVRGQVQTAYQLLVASSKEKLEQDAGDQWDSGKVETDQSVQVEYSGPALSSGRSYYWKVKIWDGEGTASAWSETGEWSMGLLDETEWKGQWIGRRVDEDSELPAGLYVRKEFTAASAVKRAMLYGTALGVYELHLNGSRVGEDYFAPGWTDYNVRTQYQTYDVTASIRQGANALGAIVGTGWYAGHVGMMGRRIYGTNPALLLQLELEFEDGTTRIIASDDSWTMSTGPLHYSDLLMGETFDARSAWPDWARPGFQEAGWMKAEALEPYTGKLVSQIDPPVRVTESLQAQKIWRTPRGTHLFDLGQNMVGWVALKVAGPAGTRIKVSHAEMLQDDNTLYTENLRRAVQEDIYILRGEGTETFEPHFTFHGFRYVEVEGLPSEPQPDTVIGRVVHSDTAPVGSLETSDPMVNQLISNIRWGQRGNYLSVPTDCPQRDERLGWTGDAQIFIRTASYNMDVARFFAKFMVDMTDFQSPEGAFPDVAPDANWFEFKQEHVEWFAPDNAGWGDAGVIIPWTLYLMYEDRRILETNYDAMKRWIAYLQANSNQLVRPDYANYGDWLSINADTPKDVLATAYFAYSTLLFSRIAEVLGHEEDARHYFELYGEISRAFVNAYVNPATGMIQGDTQTVYVLALYFGLLPEGLKALAVKRLEELIRSNGDHLSTGFLGVGYLLPTLTENGLDSLAYTLLHQDTFPSWLYSVKHGATTIWERWDGWTDTEGFQTPEMNSFNHYSLGSVGEWMYRYMAGIDVDPAQPGFKHILFQPHPGGKLSSVRASVESGYGLIESAWTLEPEGRFTLRVTVPVNTHATVMLPGQATGVPSEAEELGLADGSRAYRIGSGTYQFESKWMAPSLPVST
ncbi:glycoside hydrolase family 78 protein [Paenibacillus rigui]|uniref:alpha-L-rhamnosidase n=1 Tax=Paenibacillus rigui TaxID=554312 RepID=A0A229UVN7_9BACL|nr:glycoside hydrolase family 78 protein [Paenibacillus rigui]OXM87440.1 alpha-L-rhamnosidase [Paenibacillus rigui]